jgi:pilus assembly protein CpaB
MKSKFILIGALVFAVITTVLFSNYIKGLDAKYKSDKNMVQVVVLKQDVKKNQKVTGDMLEIKSYNLNLVLPEAIINMKDIEGSYTLIDMKAGELLFADRFTNQTKETEFLTRKISEGNRAISIGVTYVESVSTLIKPEDHVDVIYSVKNSNGLYATSTILENVRVLAVGDSITESQNITAANKTQNTATSTSNGNQAKYTSITLELNPKQSEQITNAEENGDLKFILRSELEQK